jgi:hypothetical protein
MSKPSYSLVAGFLKLQPGKSPVVPTLSVPVFITLSNVDSAFAEIRLVKRNIVDSIKVLIIFI